MENKPRSATIIAIEETYLLTLDRHNFKTILASVTQGRSSKKFAYLSNLPAFDGWTTLHLRRITYHLNEKRYRKGQFVYKQGEDSDGVYLIINGDFKFTKKQGDSVLQIGIKTDNDHFGDDEVINKTKRLVNCM